jgi:hypothetical protein
MKTIERKRSIALFHNLWVVKQLATGPPSPARHQNTRFVVTADAVLREVCILS